MKTSKKKMLAIVLSAFLLLSTFTVAAAPAFTISDVVKVLRYTAGASGLTDSEKNVFDVNFDGTVGIKDAVIVLKVIAKMMEPPNPPAGTRKNPLPLGTTGIFNGTDSFVYNFKIELTADEVIRGDIAWDMVHAANMFNEKPDEGKEYILVKFTVKALESKNDEKIDISNALFDFVSTNGVTYEGFVSIAGLEPKFSSIYKGAQMEGYAYSIIDKEDDPSIVFLDYINNGLWFATS